MMKTPISYYGGKQKLAKKIVSAIPEHTLYGEPYIGGAIPALYNSANSFFYCDPPYFNSDCGHYKGYSKEQFERLLNTLEGIKGKFLLSSYPSDLLKKYRRKNAWHQWSLETGVSVDNKAGYQKRKIEVLTANYPF